MITPFWEIDLFIYLMLGVIVMMILAVLWAWRQHEKQWSKVAPHYGSVFDASEPTVKPRPNVKLIRQYVRPNFRVGKS